MQTFDPAGGPGGTGHPSQPFPKYRPARRTWAEFLEYWQAKYPGRPLPEVHNICGLTGLTVSTVYDFLKNATPDTFQKPKDTR